ncbi:MotA/TolQ/ExbB proton channel family protein [Vibrio tubiashii]|uniref:Flagellar motor protein MotA n=2 Tax=Vibrio tubiashii ATCC 19109 TaxID=1051646 RepID=F9T6M8_9VIBR|nr:MotA/TolQ/ExbB proton channel family protein [Vibrio tubiashii]AIW14192.1 flagellar motor protein MotA [Vibrio tubiashii ATCC 19109]EGU54571.1 Tol R/Q protein [Vibrio tubiashii ATCC 19109]EIF02856.1 Tol R/Q protein [Vibrio tubiashii NCIMB 1337 = ATCC 19106]
MKRTLIASLIAFTALSFNSVAADLASPAKADAKFQKQHNVQRESGFKQTERELAALKAQLIQQRETLQQQNDQLAAQFSQNEDTLARLEEKLRLETGSLGEVFGVVRQHAKELETELSHSVTGAGAQTHSDTIKEIVAATKLPSMPQLTGLWSALAEQIKATGQVQSTQIKFVDGEGLTQDVTAQRLGAFGLVGEQGYLNWNGAKQDATAYIKQPENGPTTSSLTGLLAGERTNLIVDPSRGIMLEQLALTPSLMDRFQAGGVVGKVIIGLLVIGLIISLVRGISLSLARQKIRKQLKTPQTPTDNPLGRVLAVYSKEKNQTVEALELRLLEAVVDEQAGLEKGLSMLKLLAALAPMLGLLGTVTGMIETFQVITQFGNGDPKVMAGGISMALVTTVLGLIAAMPLLLVHNILSSQAESIRNILEKQGIALVAEQAEKETLTSENSLENAA